MGINCASLLADLFLHAYKADIHQLLLMNIQCIYILAQTFHLQNELELRNVWRYQRTNQKPSTEERHTCNNMIKEKGQTDKQRFTKYYTENKRLSELNLKPGKLSCSGRVSSSCSTCGIHRVTPVTNPVIGHEWGKDDDKRNISVIICDTGIP